MYYGMTTEELAHHYSETDVLRIYKEIGFEGCSSHSGRRTFITSAAKNISLAGGTLNDIRMLAGHSTLATTQRYIEYNTDAQKKIVEMV